MKASSQSGLIRLRFGPAEGQVLIKVLESISQRYQIHPSDLPPREAAAWYSVRGCQSAGLSSEETQEWIRHLFEFRSANLDLVQRWIATARQAQREPFALELTLDQAPAFVRVLNDHRLLLASRHDIGQREMRLGLFRSIKELSAQCQSAIFEIEWLAYMIEAVLAALPNSGADWDRSLLRPETD